MSNRVPKVLKWTNKKTAFFRKLSFFGAGDEARTRYLHLGKVALYQMSYTRGTRWIISYIQKMSRLNFTFFQLFFSR